MLQIVDTVSKSNREFNFSLCGSGLVFNLLQVARRRAYKRECAAASEGASGPRF